MNDLLERGRSAYQKTSDIYFRSAVFTGLLGCVFLLLGVFTASRGSGGEWGYVLLVIGVLFIGAAVSQYGSSKRMSQK